MMNNMLGILGGMGPMASAYFYRMITEKTAADKDQDHINIVLLSDASTPDRTAAILSDSFAQWQAAWDSLHADCETLQDLGCRAICCTCNTAHYYLHHGNYFAVNGNHTMADVFLQIMRILEIYGR